MMPKEKETREQKGQRLFNERKVRGNQITGFKVGGSNGSEYDVTFLDEHGDDIICTCVDYNIHGQGHVCKHVYATWLLFQDQRERGFYL
jgi:uncharacterized Zn finger protein